MFLSAENHIKNDKMWFFCEKKTLSAKIALNENKNTNSENAYGKLSVRAKQFVLM